jgi:exodeoxyribonuclease V beta subunit
LALSTIAERDRIAEMRFQFPVERLNQGRLVSVLETAGGVAPGIVDAAKRLRFDAVSGFMNGSIDVGFQFDGRFYFADYKTNWLGPASKDYKIGNLRQVMLERVYFLQHLIYTVAFHRYLRSRIISYDYEHHFGGGFFLFLRGMKPEHGPGRGVYFDRPPEKLVRSLETALAGPAEVQPTRAA